MNALELILPTNTLVVEHWDWGAFKRKLCLHVILNCRLAYCFVNICYQMRQLYYGAMKESLKVKDMLKHFALLTSTQRKIKTTLQQ